MFERVYIDSDGVIADFSSYVMQHYGKLPDGLTGRDKKDFWQWVQHHNDTVEPFFLNLPKMKDADVLLDYCTKMFDEVIILTATGHTPIGVGEQKREWYQKHYPDLKVELVRKSSDKARYAESGRILIDDRDKSIDPWVAAGGTGILHTSAEDTIKLIKLLLNKRMNSLDFYKRRCEALQAIQDKMRDPERKAVCDILANGFTYVYDEDKFKLPIENYNDS